jgi:hypothetical protein
LLWLISALLRDIVKIAADRTDGMVFAFVNYGARASDLNRLVRSAYMQGVNDLVDALIKSGCEIKPTATYTATGANNV